MTDKGLWQHRAALQRGLRLRYRLIRELVQRLEQPEAASPAVEDLRDPGLTRIRETVREYVPGDAIVAVASGGDEALLSLYGRSAVHFPATADGRYRGDDPVDSTEVHECFDVARAQGASFLLVPQSSVTWLSNYPEFAEHLTERFPAVVNDESCTLYSLGTQVQSPPSAPRTGWSADGKEVVSVIMPVYNGIQPKVGDLWLHETISSVLSQTEMRLELVIVDDGSVDGTGYALEYYDERAQINVVTLQKWRGLGVAMNIGIEAASGTVIGRISLGDRFLPGKLRGQLAALTERRLDVVGCAVREVDPDRGVIGERGVPDSNEEIRAQLREGLPLPPSTLLLRSKVWADVGGYSTDARFRFAEDYEFLTRVAAHPTEFSFGALAAPLCEIRHYSGRVTTSPLTRELHAAAFQRVRERESLTAA